MTEFTRKHTGRVHDALTQIRVAVETLVKRRDERRDRFAKVVAKAMETTYGTSAEETEKLLSKAGFTRSLTARALQIAAEKGRFTVWSLVDAMTQLARDLQYAGSRTEAEEKASALLSLVAT